MSTPTPTIHPERKNSVRKALLAFSIAAWITGVWLLMLVTRMVFEYVLGADIPDWARFIGQIHGLLYMVYLICTLNLGVKARWEPLKWVVTALAGTIPFLSFIVEHRRRKEVTATFQLDR